MSGSTFLAVGLFLLFLALKLICIDPVCGWSWWWVTSPLWISVAFGLVALMVMGMFMLKIGNPYKR